MRSIRSRTLALVLGLLAVALTAISYVSYRDARHEIEELFDADPPQQARLLAGMGPAQRAPAARLALQQALDEAVVGSAGAGAGDASAGERGGDEAGSRDGDGRKRAEGIGAEGIGGEGDEARPQGHEYESKLGFMVLDDRGDSLLRSASAPVAALERLLGTLSAAPAAAPATAYSAAPSAEVAGGARVPASAARLDAHLAGFHTVAMDDGDWRLFVLRDAPVDRGRRAPGRAR